MLTNSGYTVLLANDGEEAVTLYKQHQKEIDLVLLDVIMPNKDGREAYNDIRTITPDIPIIFCSGYSTSGVHTSFVLDEDINFLQKPYDPTALVSKIHELLD